jgi:hypothetical protein
MQALASSTHPANAPGAPTRWSIARPSAADDAGDVARRAHRHGRHHHARRAEGHDARHDGDRARAELRVKIEQTFQQLRSEAGLDGKDAGDGSQVDATLKARIRASGEDGRIDVRLKISVDWQGEGDAAQFAQVLEQFTQTLFGALQTLFGQPEAPDEPATPAAPAITPGDAPATTATTATPATAALTAPTTTPTTPSTDTATQTATTAASARISIRLRLSYGGFETQLPSLVHRLARSETSEQTPALQPLLEDLRSAWARLWGTAGSDPGATPTLAGFLSALGRRYSEPVPIARLPAPTPTSGALISTQA